MKEFEETDTGQAKLIRYDKDERYQDWILLEHSFLSRDNKLEAALKNLREDLV